MGFHKMKALLSGILAVSLVLGPFAGVFIKPLAALADEAAIVIDNDTPGYTSSGFTGKSGTYKGYNGTGNTRYSSKIGDYAVWTPGASGQSFAAGSYRVSIWKTVRTDTNDPDVLVEVFHNGVNESIPLDFTAGETGWVDLGVYDFSAAGTEEYVKLTNAGPTAATVHADAVKLERLPANARLAGLTVGGGGLLSPAFDPTVTAYTYAVGHETSSITLIPVPEDPLARVEVNGAPVAGGAESAPLPLAVGANTVTVTVYAQDSAVWNPYVVTVFREAPPEPAALRSLSVSAGTLAPFFQSTVYSYSVDVGRSTEELTVTPVSHDPADLIAVNGEPVGSGFASSPIPLAPGQETRIEVTVVSHADPDITRTYTIAVNRPEGWAVLENEAYVLREQEDFSFILEQKATGASSRFEPHFTVVYQDDLPNVDDLKKGTANITGAIQGPDNKNELNYDVVSWEGDPDFWSAPGTRVVHAASGSVRRGNVLEWTLPAGDGYTLSASIEMPAGTAEPKLSFTLNPSVERYYTVGFTGAPRMNASDTDWVYQPAVWQGKRIPNQGYLTDESRSGIPVVMYGKDGTSVGVAADPQEMPFRLPTIDNSRFGLLLRDGEGSLSPSVFAPIYGGEGSLRSTPFTFGLRLFVRTGDSYDTFRHLAQTLFQFEDYRENSLTTLNETLDNLEDFILNRSGRNYSYWRADYKSNEYVNDKPGYGRQQSAVDALSFAIVRDSRQIYEERTIPTIEFLASRKTQYMKLDGYDPDYPMGGPMDNYIGDWATLYMMSGGRDYAFKRLFDEAYAKYAAKYGITGDLKTVIDHTRTYSREEALTNAKRWLRPLIAAYQMTNDPDYLNDAIRVADDYIHWRIVGKPVDFTDAYSSFWNELSPMYDALFEMYDATGIEAYRDAGVQAMQDFAQFMQLTPVVPEGDVTVDGETVPAWRVSEAGLISETAGTGKSHRAIFMPYIAPYFLRAAEYSGDSFMRDIGKANLVGRYANFPGYTLRNSYSTKFEKPDYPLQWYNTYSNTAHMNHPLPMAVMIIDYLVSDVFDRSDRAITFPSRYTDTGAYFKNKVYGDRPGRFYGETGVWLWLPKGLVANDSKQINYVAGRGNGKLYVALTNQSKQDVVTTVTLNQGLVDATGAKPARLWVNNVEQAPIAVTDGVAVVTVPAGGITALAIDGVQVETAFQEQYAGYAADGGTAPEFHEYSYIKACEPFGPMTGMIYYRTSTLKNAYVYADANPKVADSMTLHYSIDGGPWQETVKSSYPFEFTVPLEEGVKEFRFYMTDSKNRTSSEQSLWASTTEDPAPRADSPMPAACPLPEEEEPEPETKPPVLVFLEDFEQDDPGAELPWTVHKGNWTVEQDEEDGGNRIFKLGSVSAGNEEGLFTGGNPTWTDYTVEARVKAYTNDGSGAASGIAARVVDANNFYLLRLHWTSASYHVQIMRKINGTLASVKSAKIGDTPPDVNKWYTLKFEVKGNKLTGYVDGEKKIEYTDDTFAFGGIGVRTWNQVVAFDDFKVMHDDVPRALPLLREDFEDGDAEGWVFASGSWSVVQEDGSWSLKQTDTGGDAIAYTGAADWSDYFVEANIKYLNTSTIISSGIVGRYRDADNYYVLKLFSDTNRLQLIRKENGAVTTLKEADAAVNVGQWHKLKLEFIGNEIRGYVDGIKKISVTDDSSLTSGAVGALAQSEVIMLDNVNVTKLIPVPWLKIQPEQPTVVLGGQLELTAVLEETGEPYGNVRWSSDNEAVAVVDAMSGTVHAVGLGTAEIRAEQREPDLYAPVNPARAVLQVVEQLEEPEQPGGSEEPAKPGSEQSEEPVPVTGGSLPEQGEDMTDSGYVLDAEAYTVTLDQAPDGRTIAGVAVDEEQLRQAFGTLKEHQDAGKISGPIIRLSVEDMAETTSVELPATALADAAAAMPEAVLSIRTPTAGYDFPVEAIPWEELAEELGRGAGEIRIRITLAQEDAGTMERMAGQAEDAGLHLVTGAMEFSVTAEAADGRRVELNDFGRTYVTRSIVWAGTDGATGTAGLTVVWIDPADGTFRFVPATFKQVAGGMETQFRRTGNSWYAVAEVSRSFPDMKLHWAKEEVELLASKLIVDGRTDDSFGPDHRITRAEFAALLVRGLGLPADSKPKSKAAIFTDAADCGWYAGVVETAAKTGLIEGFEDGSFRPEGEITREQMAVMIMRALRFAEGKEPAGSVPEFSVDRWLAPFDDRENIQAWARASVAQAMEAGIVQGVAGRSFAPAAPATRAEAAVMLKRLLQHVGFID